MYLDEELFPYYIVLTNETAITRAEMWRWCNNQWGKPHNLNKESNWFYTTRGDWDYVFKFKNEADRTLFLLRWT